MGIPVKALRLSGLKIVLTEVAVEGSHDNKKYSFQENDKTICGYFKPISDKERYPELLAKMSVATSVLLRIVHGNNAAEERLIFDDNDKIVGTLSLELPDFEPFNYFPEIIPADNDKKERVIPSTNTLISCNIITTLVYRWLYGDNDTHPHNIGLKGHYDYDMFWYEFSVYMKGARATIAYPDTDVNLSGSAWKGFPNGVDPLMHFHWPTWNYPGENAFIKGLATIVSTLLPKAYALPDNFARLAASPEAQQQKLLAALKLLVTYQPEVLRHRLTEYLGDLPLNYTDLVSLDPALPKIYEEKFPNLCNAKTNKEPFVEFMIKMHQLRYDSLYRAVTFYMGCNNNGYDLSLQATHRTLCEKPSYFKDLLVWTKNENEKTTGTKYDLDKLERRYHQFWRDSFALPFKKILQDLYRLTNTLIGLNAKDVQPEQMGEAGKAITDPSFTNVWELFGSKLELLIDNEAEVISVNGKKIPIAVDKNSNLRKGLALLVEFTNKYHKLTQDYYKKERHYLAVEDSRIFSKELLLLAHVYEEDLRVALAYSSTYAQAFNNIIQPLKLYAEQVNFRLHLIATDEQQKDNASVQTEILPPDHPEVLKQFTKFLFLWAKGLDAEPFKEFVEGVIAKYEDNNPLGGKYAASFFSLRNRGHDVQIYLEQSQTVRNDLRLAHILKTGTIADGALNTALIEACAKMMLKVLPSSSIDNALRYDVAKQNLARFTIAAVKFAKKDSQLNNVNHRLDERSLYETIYKWINVIHYSKFEKLIDISLKEYEAKLWLSTSRRRAVMELMSQRYEQARTLAVIFLQGGTESNSFNTRLLLNIINEIKKDINNQPQNPEYGVITQFNEAEHHQFYLSLPVERVRSLRDANYYLGFPVVEEVRPKRDSVTRARSHQEEPQDISDFTMISKKCL